MKNRIISLFVVFSLLASLIPSIVTQAYAVQGGDEAINWKDYYFVDESTVFSYAVDGGNLYFGNHPWDDEQTRATEIVMFGNDRTVSDIIIPETVDGRTVTCVDMTFSNEQARNVTLPGSIRSIGEQCFSDWSNLEQIEVSKANTNFYSVEGVLFGGPEYPSLRVYPAAKTQSTYNIPSGVEYVDFLFSQASDLKLIGIPVSVRQFTVWDLIDNNHLTDLYYEGSENQWEKIINHAEIERLGIHIHFNSTIPVQETDPDISGNENNAEGVVEFNTHKYKLITEEMSWKDAEAYCISLGGHLVTITSAEENSFVQSLISKSTMIGLSDAAEEGSWEWVTGESLTYTNWAKNEPNDQSNEDYVLMQVKGTWNDGHLDREKWPFICEWDGTTLPSKTYSVEEIEQMVADYFNANYQDASNPGKFVVFHGETSVTGNMCSIVVRFQSSSSSPNTAANVLFAYVSVNMETGIMTIEGVDGDTDVPLFDQSTDDEITVVPDAIQFKITTDHTSLSIRKNNKLLLGASLTLDGMQMDDTSGITFQIEDSSILEVSASFSKDNYLYVSFNALKEGTTKVLFSDSDSGAVAMIPVTVYSDSYLCYTLSSVPTKQIEKYPTNFYNVNGLYIDSYTYTVNSDKSASVSFDVYNSNYTYGAVEVYDINGNLKSAVLINKMSSSMTSMKEVLWDDVVYLVRDIYDGDLLSYRQESGFSKKTSISVTVPENGYIKICNDPENSFIVSLVNAADLLLSLASFMGEVKDYDVNSAYFSEKLTTKLVNEKIFAECVKDGSKLPKKLWSNVGEATISSPSALAISCETLVQNLSELDLEDVIIETAMDFGINVGEETFTYFAGPFGAALKAIFAIGKIENILVQHAHMTQSAGIGSIYIQNQGGGILGSQQITVESEDGFEIDTALRVFSVTLDPDMLSKIKNTNPGLYEAIEGKSSYTYDISLMKNGDTTQPGKSVTVCIPIPEAWRVPMPNDLKDSIYDGLFKIYRIEEDGTTTEMPIDVKDGCFVFETDHFSLYALAKFDVEKIDDDIGFNINSFWSWMIPVIVTIGICCCVLVVVCVLKSKKRKHS